MRSSGRRELCISIIIYRVPSMGGATMGTGGTCTPTFERWGGEWGQENLKVHTRTAVLDDSITACNAVCMMQCSFPALNHSVLHINSFRLCTLCWLCSVVILWWTSGAYNFGVKSGDTNSEGELWVLRRERKKMESKCPFIRLWGLRERRELS